MTEPERIVFFFNRFCNFHGVRIEYFTVIVRQSESVGLPCQLFNEVVSVFYAQVERKS
jgi:hypothetical protein